VKPADGPAETRRFAQVLTLYSAAMDTVVSSLNAALEGRYRVERELGEGGMATVFLAEDLRHDRRVALKVLKPELAAAVGPTRFLAEIRTTARLQHPHILPLFDSGQAGSFLFYVMPYVEGESLRSRLDRERQLPVADAVRIATQIAEALDHAHRQGVIHRDIKPGNILLRDGDVQVADFGIALALTGTEGRLTQTGLSVGTPQYMSPEQATGETNISGATDIWSLGCVLYEMLVGGPPFGRGTPQAVITRIVSGTAEPVTEGRRTTPAHVAAVVAKALERLPSDRFRTAREVAGALADPGFKHGVVVRRPRAAHLVATALVAFLLGVSFWMLLGRSRSAPASRDPIRFIIPGVSATRIGRSLAISPDGSIIAHASGGGLDVRRIADFGAATRLETEDAYYPFVSPDGKSIGFFGGVAQNLLEITIDGATTRQLAAGNGARALGGSWGSNGTIVFATTSGLYRIPPGGGDAEPLRSPDRQQGEFVYAWPVVLPGDRSVLFTILPVDAAGDGAGSIACLDLEKKTITTVLNGGSGARYVSDYLVYTADEGTLHAVSFDPATCRAGDERIALPITGLALGRAWGADFDISPEGTLVYMLASQSPATLVWLDRTGGEQVMPAPPRGYNYARVSPDGKRIAVDIGFPGARDIWIWDSTLATSLRLTNDPGEEFFAEWNAGGDSVYFSSNQLGGTFNIFRRAADGTGESQLVFASNDAKMLSQIAPDSRLVVSETRSGRDRFDMTTVIPGDPVRLDTLLSTRSSELNGVVSPDNRFIAYQSDVTGQFEVYVSPAEGAALARWKVSVDGGDKPLWSVTGDTLFYRSPADSMMAVAVDRTRGFGVRAVAPLFLIGSSSSFAEISGREWDLSRLDGRFVVIRRPPGTADGIRVVLGWTQELRRQVAR
jgi:eukaryotic-like serine/threonine-protein kinase